MYANENNLKANNRNTFKSMDQSFDRSVSIRPTIDGQNNDILQYILSSNFVVTTVGTSPLEELELKYNEEDVKDTSEMREILSQILGYPST